MRKTDPHRYFPMQPHSGERCPCAARTIVDTLMVDGGYRFSVSAESLDWAKVVQYRKVAMPGTLTNKAFEKLVVGAVVLMWVLFCYSIKELLEKS